MGVKGWQVVFTGPRLQADLLAAVLEAEGVTVEVIGDYAYGVGVGLSESKIMVPDNQARAARKVIDQADSAAPKP